MNEHSINNNGKTFAHNLPETLATVLRMFPVKQWNVSFFETQWWQPNDSYTGMHDLCLMWGGRDVIDEHDLLKQGPY